jgi:type IV pilus assembly protein PilM
MSLLSGIKDYFGLDIDPLGIRVVQLSQSGKNFTLTRYGAMEIDPKIIFSDAAPDMQRLAAAITQLKDKVGISTKNVAVSLPPQRIFTTVIDFDDLKLDELGKTILFQADGIIPTPVAESKIDWVRLGPSQKEQGKVEVLLSSVPNNFVEARLDMLESIGLNVIAFEPSSMALARSLSSPVITPPALILNVGKIASEIVIVMNNAPHLVRVIPTGTDAIVKSAMQNLNIDEKQAMQFVFKFGMSQDKLEGQIYNAVKGTVDILFSELDKSIKFFGTRYAGVKIDRIVITGDGSVLPEFPLSVANKLGLNVEIGNAWRNVVVPVEKQNELAAVSNHFSVACGLAQRIE